MQSDNWSAQSMDINLMARSVHICHSQIPESSQTSTFSLLDRWDTLGGGAAEGGTRNRDSVAHMEGKKNSAGDSGGC